MTIGFLSKLKKNGIMKIDDFRNLIVIEWNNNDWFLFNSSCDFNRIGIDLLLRYVPISFCTE